MLIETLGSDDVNNDGVPERIKECWGGTMNAPCVKYFDRSGAELGIVQQGFEWKDYWTFGLQRFRHEGSTFTYHSTNDESEPTYVSYVSPANREFVVCEFENEVRSELAPGSVPECETLLRQGTDIATPEERGVIELSELPPETGALRILELDVDNDGSEERLAELQYASGAGRGCDYKYWAAITANGRVARSGRVHEMLDKLQQSVGRETTCLSVQNRLLKFAGRTYLEMNPESRYGARRRIRAVEQQQVKTVCEFDRHVLTTIRNSN